MYAGHTRDMNTKPQPRIHVVNACRAAAYTIHSHKGARDYEARTGRRANLCGNCGKYHAAI